MILEPSSGKFKCEYCDSRFAEDYLVKLAAEEESKKNVQDTAASEQAQDKDGDGIPDTPADGEDDFSDHNSVYNCPSCGAQLVMDDTTAATYCYYCQNPVVLAGRLTRDMRPDKIIPFSIDKKTASDKFLSWAKSKKFVPRSFFDKKGIDKQNGVYYPYWCTDVSYDASFSGSGTHTSSATTAKEIITKTDHYKVEREGDVELHNIMRPALSKADRKLSDGIHPYTLSDDSVKDFSMAYLSGFMAEKRDIASDSVTSDIDTEADGYLRGLLTADAGYESLSGDTKKKLLGRKFKYMLLPAWVFTYKGSDGNLYHYTMNGQTGNVCGKLPIDKGRLWGWTAGIFAVITLLISLGGAFIW